MSEIRRYLNKTESRLYVTFAACFWFFTDRSQKGPSWIRDPVDSSGGGKNAEKKKKASWSENERRGDIV